MDLDEKLSQREASFSQKDRTFMTSEPTELTALSFTSVMTVSQAAAISKLLPKNYCLRIDSHKKLRRDRNKFFNQESKSRNLTEFEESQIVNQGSLMEERLSHDEMYEKITRIHSSLRKNRNSWPFLHPVDHVGLMIPEYLEIIKDPMDLQTISQKIKKQQYSEIQSFYSDVELIISNSFTFNKNNVQYCRITTEFQRCFHKLKAAKTTRSEPKIKRKHKKVKRQRSSSLEKETEKFLSLSDKKELSLKIKTLPMRWIVGIATIINGVSGQDKIQLNIDNLSWEKYDKILNYIEEKEDEKKQLLLDNNEGKVVSQNGM